MFYKFTVDLQRLLDDNVLPEHKEESVIFYILVIKNGPDTLLRIPFDDKDSEWKVELYDEKTEINVNRIQLSMHPHVSRFKSEHPVTLHAVKIVKDVDEDEGPIIDQIGYETHIKESTSDIQDLPFLTLSKKTKTPYFKEFATYETNKLKIIDELPLHDYGFKSQYWLTQREFYSSSHVTQSNHVYRENLQILRDKFFDRYKDYKFTNLLDMLLKASSALVKKRLKYKPDKRFSQSLVSTDAGDKSIETTIFGDCEDLSFFYMRVFRMIANTYRFFTVKGSDIFEKCKIFEEHYTCFSFICQVKQNSTLEFHCTLMIIPDNIKHNVISFEVTNPKKSYNLPSAEYHTWHNENYFLVDNYFISRVNKVSLEKIALSDLKFFNY